MSRKSTPLGTALLDRTNTFSTATSLINLATNAVSAPLHVSSASYALYSEEKPLAGSTLRRKPTRTGRYTSAERHLAESFRNCQDQTRSTSELQVEALKDAISFINSQVTDSKEQTEKLRQLLKDRATVEPEKYKEMQRQRWMEERRHQASESLSKVLQQYLASSMDLASTLQDLKPAYASASNSTSKVHANLAKFFDCSPSRQRRPTRNRIRRRTSPTKKSKNSQENTDDTLISRPHGIIPLVLKIPKQVPLFLKDQFGPAEAGIQATMAPSLSLVSPPTGLPHLSFISEIPESEMSTTSSIPFSSTTINTVFTDAVDPYGNGTAIIWRNSPRPSDDRNRFNEIMDDLVISMPDYAVDLLANFDSKPSTQPICLDPNTLSPLLSPASTTASKAIPFTPDTPRSKSSINHINRIPKSPSRKRISALFSVPDALSSRRGLGLAMGLNSHHQRQHMTNMNNLSMAPVLPDVALIHEDSESAEHFLSPPPRPVSFPSSLSVSRQESAVAPTPVVIPDEGKTRLASRLRKRVSGLIRH